MINFRMLKLSDAFLWMATGSLVFIGFFAIFSATYGTQIRLGEDPFLFVKRQFFSLLIAVSGLVLFAYLDYRHLKRLAPYLYAIMLLLLAVVLFTGSSTQGAQRWLQIGSFSFQPSEMSKLIIILALSAFFSSFKKIQSFWETAGLLFLVGIPFLLIFKQPDLGTALVVLAILMGLLISSESSPQLLFFIVTPILSIILRPFFILWLIYLFILSGALFLTRSSLRDWVLILGTNIAVGIAAPFLWGALKPYQQQRVLTFLNPGADPYGAGYHTLQSKIALGNGSLLGKGFLRGTQTQLQFIPEQHSDFIFSAIGEEFGFLGSAAVLFLFVLFIWQALVIALQARDAFGRYLALGIAVMTAFHVLANVGMTVGLLPVVGIPLPFLSYGGSSLIMNVIAVGILQSIAMRRQKLIF